MALDINKVPEAEAIVNYVTNRIKKGLGCNILVVAPPGLGKSWSCVRLMELIYERLYEEKISVDRINDHVVDNAADAFKFAREVNRAEPLTIEEVSVLFGSRRAMSVDNVEFNSLLDTCRKKQIILLMNSQHISFVDKHIRMLSHLLLECLRINKSKGICIVKPLKLQTNQQSGKVYKHRLIHNKREVHRCYLKKPTKELIDKYEEKKSNFMDEHYERMQLRSEDRKRKDDKRIGKPMQGNKKWRVELTDKESDCHVNINLNGMKPKDYAKKRGVTVQNVYIMLKKITNKANLLGKQGFVSLNPEKGGL